MIIHNFYKQNEFSPQQIMQVTYLIFYYLKTLQIPEDKIAVHNYLLFFKP
jgi:hypothetical protein